MICSMITSIALLFSSICCLFVIRSIRTLCELIKSNTEKNKDQSCDIQKSQSGKRNANREKQREIASRLMKERWAKKRQEQKKSAPDGRNQAEAS